MDFFRNFPFFSIMIAMFSGIISSVLGKKAARILALCALGAVALLSLGSLVYVYSLEEHFFVFQMGHFPAPWGNEIRAGILEAGTALFFTLIMAGAVIAGRRWSDREIVEDKQNLYYILVDMMMASLLALVYTNDLFTAYVFVEINTISACGLIMIRQIGRTFEAAMRYM
ncbi:MAG: sodium:proton antiporter, partial [Lachnospiraceae bacterium]|nr:sodium:proton antiporter [Lachnospiraceae bacterium]